LGEWSRAPLTGRAWVETPIMARMSVTGTEPRAPHGARVG